MITKTNILRAAVLCLTSLAPFCHVYAEDAVSTNPFETVFNLIKTVEINEACIEELKNALTNAVTHARELYAQAQICDDMVTCKALQAQLAELSSSTSELAKKIDILNIQRGFDDLVRDLVYIESCITHRSVGAQLLLMDESNLFWNGVRNFAKAVVTGSTYNDAWQVVVAPDTILGKAEILLDHHRPAVVGVALVTAATTIACFLNRNKIKAGWNKLFGSSTQDGKETR